MASAGPNGQWEGRGSARQDGRWWWLLGGSTRARTREDEAMPFGQAEEREQLRVYAAAAAALACVCAGPVITMQKEGEG